MLIGVPTEIVAGERRVALVPETVTKLVKAGHAVIVQTGAGIAASFPDAAYAEAGATLATNAAEVYAKADFIAKVARPTADELGHMRAGQTLLAFLSPLGDPASVESYAKAGITALSMDAIPRTTRAQSMDALSSQANIGGYKAVILAAAASPRFIPMQTTAAGTVKAQKIFVIGGGVAGLRAIATAKRLGGIVSGYDTRAAVKEQVQSLDAAFVEIDLGISGEGTGGYARALTPEESAKQQRILSRYIHTVDIVITTAAVPGRRAPILVDENAVRGMRPGSGQTIDVGGVSIIGATNLPSTMPFDASVLYSRNINALLELIGKGGTLVLDASDEIVAGTMLVRDGVIVHEPTKAALAGSSK